jgi:uncharacterized protein with HEPN domain
MDNMDDLILNNLISAYQVKLNEAVDSIYECIRTNFPEYSFVEDDSMIDKIIREYNIILKLTNTYRTLQNEYPKVDIYKEPLSEVLIARRDTLAKNIPAIMSKNDTQIKNIKIRIGELQKLRDTDKAKVSYNRFGIKYLSKHAIVRVIQKIDNLIPIGVALSTGFDSIISKIKYEAEMKEFNKQMNELTYNSPAKYYSIGNLEYIAVVENDVIVTIYHNDSNRFKRKATT